MSQNNSYLVRSYDASTGYHVVIDNEGNPITVKNLAVQGRTPEQLIGKAVEITKMIPLISEVKQVRLLK